MLRGVRTSPTNPRPARPLAGRLSAISSPGSSIRHRPSTPPSPTPTSTSPCPTTSTPEAPQSLRPWDSPPSPFPAHPRISPAHSGALSSRGSPGALWRPRRPLSPRLRRSPLSPPAPPYLASCRERPFELPSMGLAVKTHAPDTPSAQDLAAGIRVR
jgi:hypothetical protein